MGAPRFPETWSTRRRVLTSRGLGFVLVGGVVTAALLLSGGGSTAPKIATADGSVSNSAALISEADDAFNTWISSSNAVTPDAKVGKAQCFFEVSPKDGYVSSQLECGPARVQGSNTGAWYSVGVAFSLSPETQQVTGALVADPVFKKSSETGGQANLVRPDGVASLRASVLDVEMTQPASEMPMRLASTTGSGGPEFSAVTIPADGVRWNPEVDHATVSTSGNTSATIVRSGLITSGVVDPKTGITYAPQEGTEWWIVETTATSPGGWDNYAAIGTFIGTGVYSGKSTLPAQGSTIVSIKSDQPLIVYVWGSYTILDGGVCKTTNRLAGVDDNSLVVTPSDRVVTPEKDPSSGV